MKILQKTVKSLEGPKYYMKHLDIINPFLPTQLTPKEIEVLGIFMSFTGETADKDRFGTSFRKEVKASLNLSDGGLSNHLSSLKAKKAIEEDLAGRLSIKSFLFPQDKEQFYQFKITKA